MLVPCHSGERVGNSDRFPVKAGGVASRAGRTQTDLEDPPSLWGFEHHTFTVVARVVLVRPEADSDLHVVLQSGRNHMITEAPAPYCDKHATPYRRRQMRVARSHVRLCARARVTGVAFFDFDHRQTGVAPNAIELHPILRFACLTG